MVGKVFERLINFQYNLLTQCDLLAVQVESESEESVQYNVTLCKSFCAFYSSIRFDLFLQLNNFFFIYIF